MTVVWAEQQIQRLAHFALVERDYTYSAPWRQMGACLRYLVISSFNASYVLVAGLSGAHKFRKSWYALPSQRVNNFARLIDASAKFFASKYSSSLSKKASQFSVSKLKSIFESLDMMSSRLELWELSSSLFDVVCSVLSNVCLLPSRLSPLQRSRWHWNFPLLLIARAVYVGYRGSRFRPTAHRDCVTLLLSRI